MNKLYKLIDILKGQKVTYYFKEFYDTLKFTSSQVQNYQLEKLKKLLIYSYENTEFYKKRFDNSNFNPYEFKDINELKIIPVLTREDIQQNIDIMLSSNIDKSCYHGSSSGSTGTPVHYYHDKNGSSAGKAALYIGWKLSGWKQSDKGLHIWGNPSVVNKEWKRMSSILKAKLTRQHKFPAYKITNNGQMDILYKKVIANKYDYLDGYTNAIYQFAEYLKESKKNVPTVKYVITTGETLHDYQRLVIENYIGPVYDMYGCGEINGIANQCKLCGEYHIIDPHVIVEFSEKPIYGNSFSLYVTDLDNYIMPLIRYQNGDVAKKSNNNNCKIPFKTLERVEGRESDIIHLPAGGILSVPSFFGSVLLKEITSISQYQIVRNKPDLLTINLVISKTLDDFENKKIERNLKEYLGGKIDWEIKIVDKILPAKNGKYKLLIDNTRERK